MSFYKVLDKNFKSECFSNCLTECFLCDKKFDLTFSLYQNKSKVNIVRKHLVLKHQFIISEIHVLDDFKGYFDYWKKQLSIGRQLDEICAVIKTNTKAEDLGESCYYYMLCPTILPEDEDLRNDLKIAKLNTLVKIHEEELNNLSYERDCLFCNKKFIGKLKKFFEHLRTVHNLRIGSPDNIVFQDRFLNLIENKLNKYQCLFCEYTFKNWKVLKEHMRKKLHKTINPYNKEYDKFFLINYLKTNEKWYNYRKNNDTDSENDENWDDWVQDEQDIEKIKCLFCENLTENLDEFESHLISEHFFDFESEIKSLTFYEKIQFINYIRKKIQELSCIFCDTIFNNSNDLIGHLLNNNHFKINKIIFSKKEDNLQPVIDNDKLLKLIADMSSDKEFDVIPEDIN